ncbi:MAG: cytochrome c biogenesis protein ResB [Candidatus Desulfofervidaceae bacterium]|nr:cytochrome c biogenesis protein ResB [Candidatus Desulfofervidaceae bacterium]
MRVTLQRVLKFFTSVRLAIFLLLILAVACIIGTLLPQSQPPEVYLKQFGNVGSKIINAFSLYDVYHARWFQVLLSLLTLNLIACSLDRFPKTWRILQYNAKKEIDEKFLSHLSFKAHFICKLPFEEAKEKLSALFKKEFSQLEIASNPDFVIHVKKGSISHWGPYIIHGGILVILFGGLISSIFGFSGMMFIPEGEVSNTIFLEGKKHHQVYNLPFSLKCDKFTVEYYDNGMPKEYLSHITVIDNRKKFKTTIKVNGPLDYKGFRFYQANFGVASNPTVTFEVTERKTGKKFTLTAPFNTPVPLPDEQGAIKVVKAFSDLMNFGPAFQVVIQKPNQKPQTSWVLSKFPEFDAMHRKGKYTLVVKDFTRFTGLEVKKDPGVWVVWIGCIILVGGLMISFFIIPQKMWLKLAPHKQGCEVWLGGMASKRRETFKHIFQEWANEVKEVLTCGT